MSSSNQPTELENITSGGSTRKTHHNMFSGLRLILDLAGIKDRYLIAGSATAAVIISVTAFMLKGYLFDMNNLDSLGYLGVFVFTFLGAATIFLPSGGSAVVILAGAVLNPLVVGLLAGTAAVLGELTGYAIGYESGAFLDRRTKLFAKAKRWVEKRGSLTIFLLSVIPNPIFDAAGLAAGAIKFPLGKFIVFAWLGKTIQAIAGALIGAIGSDWLIGLVERIVG